MFLKTGRTYLRPFVREDLDELYQLCLADDAAPVAPTPAATQTKEQVAELLEQYIKHYQSHGIGLCFVGDAEGNFLGKAGFQFIPEVRLYEISCSLLPGHKTSTLLYTEITTALVGFAFKQLRLDKICARALPHDKETAKAYYQNGFVLLGERAFEQNGKVCIWNYFERDNDENLNQEDAFSDRTLVEEWDMIF